MQNDDEKTQISESLGNFIAKSMFNYKNFVSALKVMHHVIIIVRHLHHELRPLTFKPGTMTDLWVTKDQHVVLVDVASLCENQTNGKFFLRFSEFSGVFRSFFAKNFLSNPPAQKKSDLFFQC